MEKHDWVVVANGSQARIMERSAARGHAWTESDRLLHPESREHGTDTHGKTAGHTISGRPGLAPRQENKEHHRQIFCRQIAEKLHRGVLSGSVSGIVIFAAPTMMGELLKELDEGTRKLIVSHHEKDLTSLPVAELNDRFKKDFNL